MLSGTSRLSSGFSLHIPAVLFRSCIGPYSISSLSAVNDFSTHPSPPSFSYTHRGVVYIFSRPIHLTFFSLKISLLSTHPLLESTTSYSLRIHTERERERSRQNSSFIPIWPSLWFHPRLLPSQPAGKMFEREKEWEREDHLQVPSSWFSRTSTTKTFARNSIRHIHTDPPLCLLIHFFAGRSHCSFKTNSCCCQSLLFLSVCVCCLKSKNLFLLKIQTGITFSLVGQKKIILAGHQSELLCTYTQVKEKEKIKKF